LIPAGTGLAYHNARHMKDVFPFDNEVERDEFEVDGSEDIIKGQFKDLFSDVKF